VLLEVELDRESEGPLRLVVVVRWLAVLLRLLRLRVLDDDGLRSVLVGTRSSRISSTIPPVLASAVGPVPAAFAESDREEGPEPGRERDPLTLSPS
jgi:hypothetical protein